jgi:hypothetical protein
MSAKRSFASLEGAAMLCSVVVGPDGEINYEVLTFENPGVL